VGEGGAGELGKEYEGEGLGVDWVGGGIEGVGRGGE